MHENVYFMSQFMRGTRCPTAVTAQVKFIDLYVNCWPNKVTLPENGEVSEGKILFESI